MNELKSYTEYAVSTPTADFVIGFDFNYGEDAVNVTVDDVPASEAGYTVVYLNETTIRLSPSVPSGVVRLQRETDIDQTDHAYRAGAKFIAQTMDENFEQLRHSQQEVRDGFVKLADDTYEIIDTLNEVGQSAQDAADAAEVAAELANNAAAQVNDKVSYADFNNKPHNAMLDRDAAAAHPTRSIFDESGLSQQEINDLNKKKFYSVLEEGASITATASENYAAIQRAITKAQATNGVVWFPQLTSSFQDGVVPEGFKFNQQIVFPPKVSVKIDTPLIWTGSNNTTPLVYGQALPTNKAYFSEYIHIDVWLYNQNAADWGNDLNVGAWLYPHQFCRINLKVIQGFDCAVVLNGDKQGFVYNHIFVDELRGNRVGMQWLATNMGWVNENTFYKGRIASGPTPAGKEASNRYGVIGTTDNFSIENNHWLNPCFELGHNTETAEAVPIVLHNSSNNTFNNIRAENHKKWVARYTGASSANLITSDYGRLDSTVPLANMGSDWLAVDDQTTYKNNLFINRKYDDLFYRPFSKIRVNNFKDRFYGLDGGFGAVSGLASITPDAYPAAPVYGRGAYGDTVNADGALSFGSTSIRRVIRIKTNGAKKIVVKQSGLISGLTVKTFDTSKNLLYSTTTQYAKELNVNGAGGNAIATFGGSYALNTPLHGVSVIGIHVDVAYVDLLIGGSGSSIYSVEVSTTDSVQLEQIPFFSKKAHSVKPTVVANVDEFTMVHNSEFVGKGVYGWILAGGVWRTVNAVGLSASKTYDPPSLASGVTQSTTVTLTGATVGDAVTCSFSLVLSGTQMRAEVTAANLVTVYHRNDTGATVDLASGTLTVKLI